MRHPHYNAEGILQGHYADEQRDREGNLYTSLPIPDDHPDIVKWNEDKKPKPYVGKTLEERIVELEKALAKLKV